MVAFSRPHRVYATGARCAEDLNGAQIRTCFEQVSGKTMPQSMRMDAFLDLREKPSSAWRRIKVPRGRRA